MTTVGAVSDSGKAMADAAVTFFYYDIPCSPVSLS